MNIVKILLEGYIAHACETKTTGEHKVATFKMITEEKNGDGVEWIIMAWNYHVPLVEKIAQTGNRVFIEGRPKFYKDKMYVNLNNITVLEFNAQDERPQSEDDDNSFLEDF